MTAVPMRAAAALGVAAGLLVGLGWALLVGGLPVSIQSDQTALIVDPEAADRFDPVAWFALVSLAAGLITGALSWVIAARSRTPVLIVVIVLAGLGGGVVAELVGLLVVGLRFPDVADAAPGTVVDAAPHLRTWLLVLAQPLGAAIALTAAAALAPTDAEVPDTVAEPGLSSG